MDYGLGELLIFLLSLLWKWVTKPFAGNENTAAAGSGDEPPTIGSLDEPEKRTGFQWRRLVYGCGAAVGLCMLLGVGVYAVFQALSRGEDLAPVWSPDGRHIAFVSARDGNREIYVMNLDGAGVTRLTDSPLDETEPGWSPDGRQIIFVYGTLERRQLYVMDMDGSKRTPLTNSPGISSSPDWSPDGTKIAFVSDRDRREQIYVMKPDGTGLNKLTDIPAWKGSPDWSPDGSRIAFYMYGASGPEVGLMNADGSGLKELTYNSVFSTDPEWSPDGSRIAFTSGPEDGPRHIYIMNSDGSNQSPLAVPGNPEEGNPSWSPNGKQIAFTCYGSGFLGFGEVCVIDLDGTGLRQLTK